MFLRNRKNFSVILFSIFLTGFLCGIAFADEVNLNSIPELKKAMSNAKPGDVFILADGNYEDTIVLSGKGNKGNPIIVKAESVGGAEIRKRVSINGDYISFVGFNFTGKGTVKINGKGCRLSRCTFSNVKSGNWVRVERNSRNIEIDHCLFEDKKNNPKMKKGCQLLKIIVLNKGERHHIHHNHFRDIPKGGDGNGFETLQLITHKNPMDPQGGNCSTRIDNNLFERCNGEAEIISIKSNGNIIHENTFRDCYGSLVLRHGDHNIAAANFFLGKDQKGSGGVRLQGTDQIVVNNYFQDLGRAAVAMMDGTPDDLYIRTERALIANNTMVNCKYSLEIGINHSKHPNGTVPKDCIITGNIFYSENKDSKAIKFIKDDKPENWKWSDNIVYGNPGIVIFEGIKSQNPYIKLVKQGFYIPTDKTPFSQKLGSRNKELEIDLLRNPRKGKFTIGAIQYPVPDPVKGPLTEKDVGPNTIGKDSK